MTVTHTPEGPSYRTIAALSATEDGSFRARTNDGQAHALTPGEAQILRMCMQRTAASQLVAQLQISTTDLARLESIGLLDSDASILRRCAALATEETIPPVTDLAIMTCGNPQLLQRSVRSWVESARHHGRDLRLIVADDSPSLAQAQSQREAARELVAELGVELGFVDPATRSALAQEAASLCGVNPALLDFLVNGCAAPRVGIGGSRNLVNLLSRGRRVMCADDDIIARFETPSRSQLALWINSEDVPMHTYFFASATEVDSRVSVGLGPDAFALHESFVGHPVANVVARLSGPASIRNAEPSLTDMLQNRPVRIAATASGLVGDSASDCAAFFTLLEGGDTAGRVLTRVPPLSPSREVLRRTEFPVLCQGVYFITFCHAVDNRLALPPYFPVGRGEDQVWQKLLHWSAPDTVVAHLPLAVRHRPAGERRYSPEDYLDPCRTFPGNAFMLGLISSCPAPDPSSAPDVRLSVLGRYFQEVAADAQRFATLLNSAWQAYLRHHHALVVRALNERRDWPDWWQTAMTTILQHLARHMSSNAGIPLEYATGSGAAAMESLRRDVGTFGRLLQSWPAVRHAADQLSARLAAEPQRLRP